MKRLLLIALLFCTNAYAQDLCGTYVDGARVVMRARQGGMPITRALSYMRDDYSRAQVMRAYRTPRYMTTELKQYAIDEFVNSEYVLCHEQL